MRGGVAASSHPCRVQRFGANQTPYATLRCSNSVTLRLRNVKDDAFQLHWECELVPQIHFKVREAVERYRNQFPPEEQPTQAKIAHDCGVSLVTLSRYINGRVDRPDLHMVAKLCVYLGIEDMNDIFELQKEDE